MRDLRFFGLSCISRTANSGSEIGGDGPLNEDSDDCIAGGTPEPRRGCAAYEGDDE